MATVNPRIPNLQDIPTPFGVPLSAIYKQSFAYITVKDRLPIILTKVIDTFCRNKNQIIDTYGQGAEEDIKHIIGFISQLKNEIVTNKTLKLLRLNNQVVTNDAKEWNKYLEYRTRVDGQVPTWFNTKWLYCECYMYRVLAQEIGLTSTISNYDPFETQKRDVFINSLESMDAVASYLKNIIRSEEHDQELNLKNDFLRLLKLTLWSNRQDLSISAGSPLSQIGNPLDALESLNDNIIVNDSECAWHIVSERTGKNVENIHMVLDNAGYELFTDMCLAAFLIRILPRAKITFHPKVYPWYVSDTMVRDFHWTLEYMNILDRYPNVQTLAHIFQDYLTRQIWRIQEEPYWTGPYDFRQMKEKAPLMYDQFSNAKLVIFKGDLNYRKLLGDINFKYTTSFTAALGDFHPTNILSLRTVKSDICVGLSLGAAESLLEKDKDWMISGHYGIIQTAVHSHNT
ncbi:hypothetical protein X777_00734 [Ooceraea biroi]|uniref:Sugar phosphate phosphatase n=1 Tax=Ooceraea biroi TaxID=2015173 RepID=A0A026WRD1_OOCBI|nr:hypothetical protein X777_00734 [Ooceraea biroi]